MEMKKFNKKIVGVVAIAIALVTGISSIAVAAEDYPAFKTVKIQSYGTFTYDDGDAANDNGHDHDLYIDTTDLNNLSIAVEELQTAFRDGVNKIYNKLAGLGFTPQTKSPDDINQAIQDMYDSRYKEGYIDGLGEKHLEGAKITYIYHEHIGSSSYSGGCYTVPIRCNSDWDYTGQEGYHTGCKAHGHDISYMDGYRCSYIMGYSTGCGMSTNTIIGAVIEFEENE